MKKGYLTADELSILGWTPSMIRLLGKGEVTLLKVSREFCRKWKSRIYVEAWRTETVASVQKSSRWQEMNRAVMAKHLSSNLPVAVGM